MMSAGDAAILFELIKSPRRDDIACVPMATALEGVDKQPSRKRRRRKPPSLLNETQEEREKRLLKDRVRKQHSKQKMQSELEELQRTSDSLEQQLALVYRRQRLLDGSEVWKDKAMKEKQLLDRSMDIRKALFDEVVYLVEKAVLYKSMAWRNTEGQMIIDPNRDPWQMHTLSSNALQRAQHIQAIAQYQAQKLTPQVYSKFPTSATEDMINLVLDECGQDIEFLEVRKYAIFEANYIDVANSIYKGYTSVKKEGQEVEHFGDNIATFSFAWGGVTRRICLQRIIHHDRIFFLHRSIMHDETLSHSITEHVVSWWVFEPSPNSTSEAPLCIMKNYDQASLQTSPMISSHDYAVFLQRTVENEERMNDMTPAEAAMLYAIISSSLPLDASSKRLVRNCKRRKRKTLALLSETPEQRQERLMKDRVRKQQSKERFQSEIDELKLTIRHLQDELSCLRERNGAKEKQKYLDAVQTRTLLFNQLVHLVDKAVLYKSMTWRPNEHEMIIDPKRDPWHLHTLASDPMHRSQHVHVLAEFQRNKLTPELYGRLGASPTAEMFSIVLDEYGQDISFLEQRKYGIIHGNYMDVARTMYSAFSRVNTPDREAHHFGDYLVLSSFFWGGVKRRVCLQLVPDNNRVFLMHRSVLYDETLDHEVAEHVATWWCFEAMPNNKDVCILRGYTQICLATTPSTASHDYAVFMKRSTENEARVNDFLASKFRCFEMR
ncbi:hypothetical protein THRCLA_00075 [Thraustotheca clavata]|uniref:Uncharacterized protein n=1 Tax=Thraustotheca clavata TaxID=74557 RepID=A0A1W0ACF5_9STRA|nr:hypothetical protein THRCLA_00075 [Thraustotheca clavata]